MGFSPISPIFWQKQQQHHSPSNHPATRHQQPRQIGLQRVKIIGNCEENDFIIHCVVAVNNPVVQVDGQLQVDHGLDQRGLQPGQLRARFSENFKLTLHCGAAHFVCGVATSELPATNSCADSMAPRRQPAAWAFCRSWITVRLLLTACKK